MSYTYGFTGDYVVSERLPHVPLGYAGDYVVAKGAVVLVKVGGRLVECRVWIKRDGVIVDAGA